MKNVYSLHPKFMKTFAEIQVSINNSLIVKADISSKTYGGEEMSIVKNRWVQCVKNSSDKK